MAATLIAWQGGDAHNLAWLVSSQLDQLTPCFSRRARKKARSVDMNRASIGAMSFAGSTFRLVCRASTSAYATRSRCTAAGSSTVSLTGLSSGTAVSFSFAMFSVVIGREHEIAIDDHAGRESWPDRQRGLGIDVAAYDQLAGLVEAVDTAPPERRH